MIAKEKIANSLPFAQIANLRRTERSSLPGPCSPASPAEPCRDGSQASSWNFTQEFFSIDWKSNPEPKGTASDLILIDEKNSGDDLPRALFRHSISFDQFFPFNNAMIS